MKTYVIWVNECLRWRPLSTTTSWPDALLTMEAQESLGAVAVLVVRDGPVDRHLREKGRLPPHTKQQIVAIGRDVMAERSSFARNQRGISNE
jgi:hypothetical protein